MRKTLITSAAAACVLAAATAVPAYAGGPAQPTDATVADFNNTRLPNYCDLPEGAHLTDGEYHAAPGEPEATVTAEAPQFADLDQDGQREAVGVLRCSAGGTSWPDAIIVVGAGGETKDFLVTGEPDRAQHSAASHLLVTDDNTVAFLVRYVGAHDGPQSEKAASAHWIDGQGLVQD